VLFLFCIIAIVIIIIITTTTTVHGTSILANIVLFSRTDSLPVS